MANVFDRSPLGRLADEWEREAQLPLVLPQPKAEGAEPTRAQPPSDRPAAGAPADSRAPSVTSTTKDGKIVPPKELVPLFTQAARKYKVPVNVLAALAAQESSFNPLAEGEETEYGRAKGLMQYLDSTAQSLGINPYDPAQAIDAAARQIRERLDRGYSMDEAVREHFAGPDRKKWGPKTERYGVEVLDKARRVDRTIFAPQQPAPKAEGQAAPGGQPDDEQFRRAAELVSRPQPTGSIGPAPERGIIDELGTAFQTVIGRTGAGGEDKRPLIARLEDAAGRVVDAVTPDSLQRGVRRGKQGLMAAGDGLMPESVYGKEQDRFATAAVIGGLEREAARFPQDPARQAALVRIGEAKGFGEAAREIVKNPGAVADVVLESLGVAVPQLAATSIAGAAGGAPASVIGAGASSFSTEYAQAILEAVQNAAGGDLTDVYDVARAMNDPEIMAAARERGVKRGIPIAVFDALTAGLAGQIIRRTRGVVQGTLGAAGEAGVQGIGGVLGETGAQLATDEWKPGEILLEGFAEVPTAAIEAPGNIAHARRNQRAQERDIANAAGTIDQLDEAGMATTAADLVTPRHDPPVSDAIDPDVLRQANEQMAAAQQPAPPPPQRSPMQSALDAATQAVAAAQPAQRAVLDIPSEGVSIEGQIVQQDETGTLFRTDDGREFMVPAGDPDATVRPVVAPEAELVQPEPVADTLAQIEAIRDPSSAKDAALITPNSEIPEGALDGLAVVETSQGLFVTSNPEKAAAAQVVGGQLTPDQVGELLGYTTPKDQNDGTVVQATDAAGNVVHEEATNAANLEAAAARAEEMAPDGGQVQITDAVQALGRREQGVAGEPAPASAAKRPLAEYSEPELRARLKYLRGQAKTSGWNKALIEERRAVEAEIDRRAVAAKETTDAVGQQPTPGDEPVRGAEAAAPAGSGEQAGGAADARGAAGRRGGAEAAVPAVPEDVAGAGAAAEPQPALSPAPAEDPHAGKWFGSREKAEAYIAKKKAGDTHEVVQTGRVRFEIKPKAAAVPDGVDEATAEFRRIRAPGNVVEDATGKVFPVTATNGREITITRRDGTSETVQASGYSPAVPKHPNAKFDMGDRVIHKGRAGEIESFAYPREGNGQPRYNVAFDDGVPSDSIAQNDLKRERPKAAAPSDSVSVEPVAEADQGADLPPIKADELAKLIADVARRKARAGVKDGRVEIDGRPVAVAERRYTSADEALEPVARRYVELMQAEGRTIPTDPAQMSRDQFVMINELSGLIGEFEITGEDIGNLVRTSAGGGLSVDYDALYDRVQADARVQQEAEPSTSQKHAEIDRGFEENRAAIERMGLRKGDTVSVPFGQERRTGTIKSIDADQGSLEIEVPGGRGGQMSLRVDARYAAKVEPEAGGRATPLNDDFGNYSIPTGSQLVSQSGRELSPSPKWDDSTPRKRALSLKRQRAWLVDEAIKESEAGGPAQDFQTGMLRRINPDNLSRSDFDTVNDVLFGDPDGPKPEHFRAAPAKPAKAPAARKPSKSAKAQAEAKRAALAEPMAGEEADRAWWDHRPGDVVYLRGPDGKAAGAPRVVEEVRKNAEGAPVLYEGGRALGRAADFTRIPPEQAVQEPTASNDAEWGANNTLVTRERAAELRERLKKKLAGQLNSGIDPEVLAIGAELAAFHIEAGARKFADFARAIARDLDTTPQALRQYLRAWYNAGRDLMEDSGRDVSDMNTPDEVRAELAALVDNDQGDTNEQPQPLRSESGSDAAGRDQGSAEAGPAGAGADGARGAEAQRAAGELPEPADRDGGGDDQRGVGPDSGRDAGDDRPAADRADGEPDRGAGQRDGAGAGDRGDRRAGRDAGGRAAGRGAKPVRADGPVSAPRDYRIQPGELARDGGWKATAERNVQIVELVKALEKEGRQPTDAERALMTRFTGWGASEIANGIFPDRTGRYKDGWQELGERLKAALTPEEYETARRSTQYAHYTSEGVIRSIYQGLERLGFGGGRVLEPGMGVGLFKGLMPDAMAANSQYTGIEYDRITGAIAKYLYPASNVLVEDFTKTRLPRDFFDAAIGNPPFSQTRITNDPEYKKHGFLLHDYFFAKTIDRVKPGGLLVFVTSKGTMDKANDRARRYLADRADLLGAVRLPQTAFKGNAGTEVVTDVLFLRKRLPGEKVRRTSAGAELYRTNDRGETVGAPVLEVNDWLGLAEVQTPQGPAQVNEYFAAHPEMVLGEHAKTGSMYRADEYTVTPRAGEDIEQAFARAVQNLPEAVYRPDAGSQAAAAAVRERDFNPTHKKEGGLYLSEEGALMRVNQGVGEEVTHRVGSNGKPIALTPKNIQWLKDWVGLRDALKAAHRDQLNDGDWEASLKALNQAYDRFVKKHGPILAHSRIEREGADGETTVTLRFKNAPLYRMDVEGVLASALEVVNEDGTIEKGAVLKGRVLKKPTEPTIRTVQDAMMVQLNRDGRLNIDQVAKLAGTTREAVIAELDSAIYEDPAAGWITADEYLSGNVVRKLEEARAAAAQDRRYQRNVDALLSVQPRPLAPSEITVRLGANWVPADDIAAFAREVLGNRVDVTYNERLGSWSAVAIEHAPSEYSTARMTVAELLDALLNNRQITVRDTVPDGKGGRTSVVNPQETEAANDRARKIKEAFARWLWSDPDRTDRLTTYYNQHFNNIVPRQFDGSHLTLPGVSLRFALRPHQKRAIWRNIQQGDTYYAHAVGAGKTFTAIAAGMEQRRLGLINKPAYVVPNHMLNQFSREFLELYPTANIMVADEHNFHTNNRRQFIAQAALNDPDAIILTHSSFGRVGMSPEFQKQYIESQIAEWKAALDELDSSDRITKKGIEQRIEQLERRLEAKMAEGSKDQVMTFEELGVDYLFVDEAHEFRKLDFATNQARIKGIDPQGSQRAFDLHMKVEYLRGKRPGRSLTMMSGTPVTNTMGELFTVQRFFQPDQLEEDGLASFDAWASQYGDIVTGLEQNAAGGYQQVSRFAKFQNVPELMHRIRSFMDILTSDQLGDLVQRPAVAGGQREIVVVPAEEGYRAYQKTLEQRIKAIAERRGPPKPGDDIILNVIGDGRFSAIDMRFVDPSRAPSGQSKLDRMLDQVIEDYRASADWEYTTDGKKDERTGAALMIFTDIGLGEQSAEARGFDMKAWIEKRLTDAGIPREHIAFMRDYKQHAKKEKLFADVREGRKRILIGGKDMETGVNVQKRLAFLYHLDAPWFPASVEQREGRIIRQGNQNRQVTIRAYATKGSYDSTMWGMNARKQRFIDQAMSGNDSVRSLEDVSESSAFEMAAALASGDERYLKLAGLRGDVERLTRLANAHHDDQRKLRRDREAAQDFLRNADARRAAIEAAIERRQPIKAGEFQAKVGKETFDSRDEFSGALYDAFKELSGKAFDGQKKIGEIGGFDILYNGHLGRGGTYSADVTIDLPGDPSPLIEYPLPGGFAVNGIAARAANQVMGLDKALSDLAERRAATERRLATLENRIGAPFPEQGELLEKQAELAELEAELAREQPADQPAADGLDNIDPASQTDSPAFRRWFGDSKIVDSAGNPMRVFHGTMTDLQHAVDAKAPLYVTNSPRYANYYAAGEPTGSPLSWDGQTYPVGDMTASEQRAEVERIERELRELASREPSPEDYEFLRMHQGALDYIREAGIADSLPPSGAMIYRRALAIEESIQKTTDERQRLTDEWRQAQDRARIATPNVSALYAKVENPYWTDNELLIYNLASDPEGIASLKARGYDGVIWSPEGIDAQLDGTVNVQYGAEILVFDASRQIKSATANRGTFDPDSANILEAADGGAPSAAPAAARRPSPAHVAAAIENGRIDAEELGLRAAVEKVLGAKVASRVIFHRTYDALPDRLRAGIMRRMEQRGGRGQTGALYDPETGRVYVFTHVVKAPDRAVWNALHELAGHHGLRSLLGDRLGQALQVADQNETVSRVADAIARERNIPRARRQLAVEEALAELAAAVGTGNFDHIRDRYGVEVSDGMRARVQGAIRNFLRRLKELLNDLFGRPVFTDEDVRALLEAARAAATVRVGPPGQRGIGLDAVEAGQTDTAAFRRWFGDSKVVDENGDPLVVYHATDNDFSVFDLSRAGENTDNNASSEEWAQTARMGFWFSDHDVSHATRQGAVMPVYLSLKNPKRYDSLTWLAERAIPFAGGAQELRAELESQGHDGLIVRDEEFGGTSYVAFYPEQIKSATANRGTFDPASPNILENVEPEIEVDPARIRMEKKPLREAVGGALTTLKRHGFLPMTPLNYLVDYARGALRDAVAAYVDTKRAMDTYRGEKHAAYDAHAQRWLAWAAKNPAASASLGQLMHDSTIAQIDPSEELPAKLAGDAGAVQRYNALRERFEALPEEGQALYRDTRDLYKAQAAELDAIIEANVGKQMDLARERADAAYRQELAEIRDSGMEGDERAAAEAAAKQRHVDATAGHRFRKQARMLRLRQMLESNRLAGPYFPLARFGDYTVSIRDAGGELVSFSRFEKPGDAAWFAKQARATWPSMQVEEGVLTEKEGPTGAVGAKFMADLEEILGGSNVPDSLRDEVWQRYLMTMPDFSMRKRFIHRKGTPGYHRDPIRAFGSAMFHGAHQMARLKYGPDLTAALRDVQRTAIADEDSVNAGILANELKKRHDWVLDPKGAAWAQAISSGAFIWNLAVSPAAALVNLTQTYVLGVPVLGSRLGGVTRALAELSKASAQLFSARGFHLSNRVKGDELRAMEEFYKLGLIDRTQSHDLAGVGETGVEYSVTRQKWMARLSFLFHHAERVNREVTALAAYRLARQRGQGHDAAVKTAAELTWLTHFDYSNSSRARYAQSDVAKVLLIHKQHSLNMTYRLFRDLNDMLRGATPEERKIARSQFVGVMAMHGVMAGVRGLPFYSIAMVVAGLLKDAFGDDDDERTPEDIVKAWLYDSGMPRWMADTLLYGAPSVATGLDISSRVGFPDLFFRSPNKELEGRAEAEYWTMQILGAAAAIPVQVWTGVNTIREGNVARGVEQMMPKFVRDVLKAGRYAREGALTFTGDPIVDEMRAWELVGQAAGFTPFELSKAYDENNARKRLETAINNRRARLMNRYALAWRMEDEAAMDELEREFERFNDAYPEKPITAQSVRSSIRSRERRSARSSGGLVLDSRLEERINRELGLEVEAE